MKHIYLQLLISFQSFGPGGGQAGFQGVRRQDLEGGAAREESHHEIVGNLQAERDFDIFIGFLDYPL